MVDYVEQWRISNYMCYCKILFFKVIFWNVTMLEVWLFLVI